MLFQQSIQFLGFGLWIILHNRAVRLERALYACHKLRIGIARFVRMLSSLIKNSREAMIGGGILTVTTDLVPDQVVLRISDTGVGIPTEILPRLFEPFVTHGKASGTGLGLAISRGFIEAMNGTIVASNRSDHSGAMFTINLPIPRQRQPFDAAA